MLDLADLEQKAKAATPGMRQVTHFLTGSKVYERSQLRDGLNIHLAHFVFKDDAEFAAACSPDVLLALLARVRVLEHELRACIAEHPSIDPILTPTVRCPRCERLQAILNASECLDEHV